MISATEPFEVDVDFSSELFDLAFSEAVPLVAVVVEAALSLSEFATLYLVLSNLLGRLMYLILLTSLTTTSLVALF